MKNMKLGKPFKSKIGGRDLIGVKLYTEDGKEYYINIDMNSAEKEKWQAWINERIKPADLPDQEPVRPDVI